LTARTLVRNAHLHAHSPETALKKERQAFEPDTSANLAVESGFTIIHTLCPAAAGRPIARPALVSAWNGWRSSLGEEK
jgi:hypothetical protein